MLCQNNHNAWKGSSLSLESRQTMCERTWEALNILRYVRLYIARLNQYISRAFCIKTKEILGIWNESKSYVGERFRLLLWLSNNQLKLKTHFHKSKREEGKNKKLHFFRWLAFFSFLIPRVIKQRNNYLSDVGLQRYLIMIFDEEENR